MGINLITRCRKDGPSLFWRAARILTATVGLAVLALTVPVITASPAAARSSVHVGIGIGVPWGGWSGPAYYYPPYYYAPPAAGYYYGAPVYAAPAYSAQLYSAPPPAVDATSAPYVTPGGQTCREYQGTIIVGGRPVQGVGTACLQPDGTWRIVR